VADPCECGNEPSDSIKCGEFGLFDEILDSQELRSMVLVIVTI